LRNRRPGNDWIQLPDLQFSTSVALKETMTFSFLFSASLRM